MSPVPVQLQGFLWCMLLFALCAVIVHSFKLILIGWRSFGRQKTPEPVLKQEKPPEPVYYLVERKKKRPKAEYAEPKQINFQ